MMKPTTALRSMLGEPGIIVAPGAYDGISARLIEAAGFKQLDPDFLILEREPGGACYGDSGGPILLQSGGVEYVVATLHGAHTKVNSNVKQDCTGDFAAQRVDLRAVLDFIQANIASHGP